LSVSWDAGDRRVDGIGQEIDRQLGWRIEQAGAGGGLERLDAAALVECVAISLGDAR
jgi:hypothetical protein